MLFSPKLGLVIQDLLFACYHAGLLSLFFEPSLLVASLVVLAASAWLWRRMVMLTDGIGIAILLHAAADISIIMTARLAGVI